MKKIILPAFLLVLIYAPFAVSRQFTNYYERYEAIAKKYECYPVETCQADFNGDGKPDRFVMVDEPNDVYLHYYRLKIFIEENGVEKEILDLRYDQIDNTYRTHTAVVEQFGEKKLIIYDTVNKEPYYIWDGSRLAPVWDGKTPSHPVIERAIHEREIRQAMALEDDTGGFNQKIMFQTSLYSLFALYYTMLSIAVGIYVYFTRRSKPKFFR